MQNFAKVVGYRQVISSDYIDHSSGIKEECCFDHGARRKDSYVYSFDLDIVQSQGHGIPTAGF